MMATQSQDFAAMLANVMAMRRDRRERKSDKKSSKSLQDMSDGELSDLIGTLQARQAKAAEAAAPVAPRAAGESRVPGQNRTVGQSITRTGENMADAMGWLMSGAPEDKRVAYDPAEVQARMGQAHAQIGEEQRLQGSAVPMMGQREMPAMAPQAPQSQQPTPFEQQVRQAYGRGAAKKAKVEELMAQGMSRGEAMRAVFQGGGVA